MRIGAMLGDIRTGTGYDVHAFGEGDHLMLCGVRVPHSRGFLAHSDGDVGLHALVDAILGALADGDIGSHFPPSDPQWKGAASDRFLKYAVDRVAARGGRIANLEVTLICERPKIGPLRDTMRARIADITGLNISRVAVALEGNGFGKFVQMALVFPGWRQDQPRGDAVHGDSRGKLAGHHLRQDGKNPLAENVCHV